MKKFFSLVVMSLVALLPFRTDAATSISPSCGEKNENGVITCTVGYNITNPEGAENLTVTLTEHGGANVVAVNNANDTDWSVASSNESDNVWTVLLVSPGVSGEGNLFSFQYQVSGETDCKISISLNNETMEVTPEEPKNPETGTAFPYIALGAMALVAAGAYLATKNKSKMYKI